MIEKKWERRLKRVEELVAQAVAELDVMPTGNDDEVYDIYDVLYGTMLKIAHLREEIENANIARAAVAERVQAAEEFSRSG